MIVCEHEQGSDAWLQDRSGIPTASSFGKIITSTGKASTQAKGYMDQLLADWWAGHPVDVWEGNAATDTGTEREPESRDMYSFITGNDVEQIGFCMRDDRLVGCSPDGVIWGDGLVEFKNPKASTLVSYHLGGKMPAKYTPQVQGQMWIMGREWCDFFVNHPDIDPFHIHVERDEKYIISMEKQINNFIESMIEKREILTKIKGGNHE